MTDQSNTFRSLFQIDVAKYVEMKGQFSYLSWPFAVAQLRLADPNAFWEVRRFDGLPYLNTELGYFVEVAVTVQGVTLSQIHPVLDHKNRPIMAPSPFDINTSIQRSLVKAIALHGLGLNIYAGEDLPDLNAGGEPPTPTGAVEPVAKPEACGQGHESAQAGTGPVRGLADGCAVALYPEADCGYEQQYGSAAGIFRI
ncbi:MAG: DUF1071 domain-containing protein [Dechloromonas sp.]|uniref:DUF1071 domain-containing protein n=1 Tax=Candidatus Dechloromonas phosphorivorans TaxID=2899244 RepID=A0A935N279_9RHOO|nr:DUF1071 domain-containing protein [Candidatus Dechloromonas phosphorivorans]